jgi:hypothetical protein
MVATLQVLYLYGSYYLGIYRFSSYFIGILLKMKLLNRYFIIFKQYKSNIIHEKFTDSKRQSFIQRDPYPLSAQYHCPGAFIG